MLSVTQQQINIINDPARFKVVVAGRRWGKTHLSLYDLLINERDGAWKKPKMKNWFVSPTYRQSKNIAWNILKEIVYEYPQTIRKKNEAELSIELINGSVVELKGADNQDSLRGVGLNKVNPDEFAYMKSEVWQEVLRPALSDKKGSAMFIGTPGGYNHFYDLYQMGLTGQSDYKSWHYKSIDSSFLEAGEIESAKKELDERTFRQEYEASFETAMGKIYYCFDRETHLTDIGFNQSLPIDLCVDFNINPMCWAIIQNIGGVDVVVDEIILPNSNTELAARTLRMKYPTSVINVYGDYSGTFRHTSSPTTDYEIIKSIIKPRSVNIKPDPPIIDRINSVNSRLRSMHGDINLLVNKKCTTTIRDFEQVTYKEGTRDINKTDSRLTHISDAIGYRIEYLYPIRGNAIAKQWNLR